MSDLNGRKGARLVSRGLEVLLVLGQTPGGCHLGRHVALGTETV